MNAFSISKNKNRSATAYPLGIVAGLAILFTAQMGAAQEKDWEEGGEIRDVNIEIVKERQITLPQANRNFEKVPPRPSEPTRPPMTYSFQSFNFQAPQVNPAIRPLKLKQPSSSDIYGNYVRIGYGNYASPLLEAYLNSRKDRNKLLGAHFYHQSSGKGPVDGKNSGSGTTGLSLSARAVGEDLSLAGNAAFENRSTTFYGYPTGMEVDKDSIKQAFNLFKLSGELSNSKNSDFAYTFGAGFSYLGDKFSARETEIDLDFKLSYEMDEDSRINLSAGYYMISRKDDKVEGDPRSLFVASPSYVFSPVEDLTVTAGLSLAFENDTIDSKNIHIYPDFKVSYPVSPSVDFVAHLGGGMEKVSLQTLSNENLWLAPDVPIFHTSKNIDFGAGINARLGNKVAINTGLALASLKHWYYFVNSPEDQAKFDVVYDDGATKRTNFFAALSYAQSETIKVMLRGDVFGYDTDDLDEAYHRPTYKFTANAAFNLYQKLIFKADLIAQGGMKAYDFADDKTVTLDAAFDLNLKTEYLFSNSFSAFIQLNNITSNEYPVFLHYPVRGFQAMAGITWSF